MISFKCVYMARTPRAIADAAYRIVMHTRDIPAPAQADDRHYVYPGDAMRVEVEIVDLTERCVTVTLIWRGDRVHVQRADVPISALWEAECEPENLRPSDQLSRYLLRAQAQGLEVIGGVARRISHYCSDCGERLMGWQANTGYRRCQACREKRRLARAGG